MEAGYMNPETDARHLLLRDGCSALQIKVELAFFQRFNDFNAVMLQPIIGFCFVTSAHVSWLNSPLC